MKYLKHIAAATLSIHSCFAGAQEPTATAPTSNQLDLNLLKKSKSAAANDQLTGLRSRVATLPDIDGAFQALRQDQSVVGVRASQMTSGVASSPQTSSHQTIGGNAVGVASSGLRAFAALDFFDTQNPTKGISLAGGGAAGINEFFGLGVSFHHPDMQGSSELKFAFSGLVTLGSTDLGLISSKDFFALHGLHRLDDDLFVTGEYNQHKQSELMKSSSIAIGGKYRLTSAVGLALRYDRETAKPTDDVPEATAFVAVNDGLTLGTELRLSPNQTVGIAPTYKQTVMKNDIDRTGTYTWGLTASYTQSL